MNEKDYIEKILKLESKIEFLERTILETQTHIKNCELNKNSELKDIKEELKKIAETSQRNIEKHKEEKEKELSELKSDIKEIKDTITKLSEIVIAGKATYKTLGIIGAVVLFVFSVVNGIHNYFK
jgi:predicted Holliday junction resolvase-like endonuclease